MELVPDITNVVYIDEYPELKKRVWLRRLNEQRLGSAAVHQFQYPTVTEIPRREADTPDGVA